VESENTRALAEGAAALGVPLDGQQLARFAAYHALLQKWNARIKLTSVIGEREVVEKHFLDSLAVMLALGGATTLVDVGSGAGFPGVVARIARPGLHVTCVESIAKKAAFLEAVKRELVLPEVEVFAGRMEALAATGRTFGAAVSRATFAPPEWIARGSALVSPGGRLIAMVVPGPAVTVEALAPRWEGAYERAWLSTYASGRALAVFDGRRST
jgi:16S rRNA (guanine527-N7)-methyltransferase